MIFFIWRFSLTIFILQPMWWSITDFTIPCCASKTNFWISFHCHPFSFPSHFPSHTIPLIYTYPDTLYSLITFISLYYLHSHSHGIGHKQIWIFWRNWFCKNEVPVSILGKKSSWQILPLGISQANMQYCSTDVLSSLLYLLHLNVW